MTRARQLSEVLHQPHACVTLTRNVITSFSRVPSVRRWHSVHSLLPMPASLDDIHVFTSYGMLGQYRGFTTLDPFTPRSNKSGAASHLTRSLSTEAGIMQTKEQTLPDTYNDLRFGPEGEIIIDMITRDDYSVARAVEAIVGLTATAASLDAKSFPDDLYSDRLYCHADNVALAIHGLSRRLRHNQQSKLVDFFIQLQQQTVPNHTNTRVLKDEFRLSFWANMPEMDIKMADYKTIGTEVGDVEDDGHQLENFTAWFARLAEMKFDGYDKGITWSHPALTCIFRRNYQISAEDVRVMCMWFIYAPKKVWLDARKGRIEAIGLDRKRERFHPEDWLKWKHFLQDCKDSDEKELADEYTQELIGLALQSIEKIESQSSNSR